MVVLKRKFISVGEVWFDEDPGEAPVDLLLYYHASHPVNPEHCRDFYSIEISLAPDADTLLSNMKKDMRYKINRAGKDRLAFEAFDGTNHAVLNEFWTFFDAFAASRNVSPANRPWLEAYVAAGRIVLTRVTQDGLPLVWHTYYQDAHWARQLQSASEFRSTDDPSFRSLIGRANRYLHWCDIQHFKQRGVSTFDLGGWYEGKEDEQRLRINSFKEEFGGTISRRYYSMRTLTSLGKAFVWGHVRRHPDNPLLHMM